jgi:glutamine synthetase
LPYKVIDGKIEPLTFTEDDVIQKLKDEKKKFLDLQFTGLNGRFHNMTMAANMFHKEDFEVGFEVGLPKLYGSSIRILQNS